MFFFQNTIKSLSDKRRNIIIDKYFSIKNSFNALPHTILKWIFVFRCVEMNISSHYCCPSFFYFFFKLIIFNGKIVNIIWLCPKVGHADPPPPLKKDHLKKVVMNGAECSEQNVENNKKILRFFFRVIIENWGHLFRKITLKWP